MFYEIIRHKYEGELPCKTRGFLMIIIICVFYIMTTPTYCVIKITQKELYDFYYTLVTLTAG